MGYNIFNGSHYGPSVMGRLGMVPEMEDVRKVRSQADKVGKHKYEIALLHRIENRINRVEQMQRVIFHGLRGYFQFSRPLIEEVACESEMDLAVVGLIFESGSGGILAKDIAVKLPQFKLEQHKIQRLLKRVNRRVADAFGEAIIEKQGKKWAFTRFGTKIWGMTKEEIEEEKDEVDGEEEP
jgi:hypothetical protein